MEAMYHGEVGPGSDEDMDSGGKPTLGFLPSFSLASCVILGEPLKCSVLPFPHL